MLIALSVIVIGAAIALVTPDTIALVRPTALITSILAIIIIGKLQVLRIGAPASKQVTITDLDRLPLPSSHHWV